MRESDLQCPACRADVAQIEPSDLFSPADLSSETSSAVWALLNRLDVLVCPKCGVLSFLAGKRVRRMAQELLDERGGHA